MAAARALSDVLCSMQQRVGRKEAMAAAAEEPCSRQMKVIKGAIISVINMLDLLRPAE